MKRIPLGREARPGFRFQVRVAVEDPCKIGIFVDSTQLGIADALCVATFDPVNPLILKILL